MTVSISTACRNSAGDSIVDRIDLGTTNPNGLLEIREGGKPASPQAAATGTILSQHSLSNPAWNTFSNGSAFANTIADDIDVDNSGVAGWFRIYDRDNVAIMDGEITVTGGGGDIEFDNINFIKGGTVVIASLEGIMPQ